MADDNSTSDDARLGSRMHVFPAHLPTTTTLHGTLVTLERVTLQHCDDLYDHLGGPLNEPIWTFAHMGPFLTPAAWRTWLERVTAEDTWYLWAIVDKRTGRAFGTIGVFEVDVVNRTCLLGYLYTALNLYLNRSTTEAVFLLLSYLFDDLGFRRVEWEMNAHNETAKRAMVRLGFVYEGTLRRKEIVKGFNRDASVYSVVEDDDWPTCKWAFRRWLMEDNFDSKDRQRKTLAELREMCRARGELDS